MKSCIALLIILFLSYESNSQGYLIEMSDLVDKKDYVNSFEYGKKAILNLKAQKKQNCYLEFLTWASYVMYNNTKGRPEGCKILQDFLIRNISQFTRNGNLLQLKIDTICLRNQPVYASDIIRNIKDPRYYHTSRSSTGAGYYGYFKSYKLLQKSSSPRSFFKTLSEQDFDKIVHNKIPEGYLHAGEKDTSFESQMKTLSKSEVQPVAEYIETIYKTKNWVKSENFIVVSSFYSKQHLTITANHIEKVLNFYVKRLGLKVHDNYIVIYLSKEYAAVGSDIYKFYNIKANSTIGFTDISSSSIVAWIPGSSQTGTLKHELIHILFFNEFKFAPPWFEEAVASLFEESRFLPNGEITALNNWRMKFLQALSKSSVDSLVDGLLLNDRNKINYVREEILDQISQAKHVASQDFQYQYLQEDIQESTSTFAFEYVHACKQALARYLLMYLHNKGELLLLLTKINQNENIEIDNFMYKQFHEIYIEVSGATNYINAKQDFLKWFNNQSKQ